MYGCLGVFASLKAVLYEGKFVISVLFCMHKINVLCCNKFVRPGMSLRQRISRCDSPLRYWNFFFLLAGAE